MRHDRTRMPVWSMGIRAFHWLLVCSIATAWFSAGHSRGLHEYAGYLAIALVGWRLILGWAGDRYARFSQFVRTPRQTALYLADVFRGRERRYLGHNPAGAAMVLVLLGMIGATGLTGWLQTTDAYWGIAWVEETHEVLANLLPVFIALHVGGVVLASYRHRENLVRAMVMGWKRAAGSRDIA